MFLLMSWDLTNLFSISTSTRDWKKESKEKDTKAAQASLLIGRRIKSEAKLTLS